jgi:hypothetical protein
MKNLEQDIINELGEGMQSEMDFHILSDMLVRLGWKKIVLTKLHSRKNQIIIHQWCEEHIKYSYEHKFGVYIFENDGDAVNFTLKWLH